MFDEKLKNQCAPKAFRAIGVPHDAMNEETHRIPLSPGQGAQAAQAVDSTAPDSSHSSTESWSTL